MVFQKLERLNNIHEGYRNSFAINGSSYLLIHEMGKTHIILDQCPHMKKQLGPNCIHQNTVRCPWHGIEYQLDSGESINLKDGKLILTKLNPAYEQQYIGFYIDSFDT